MGGLFLNVAVRNQIPFHKGLACSSSAPDAGMRRLSAAKYDSCKYISSGNELASAFNPLLAGCAKHTKSLVLSHGLSAAELGHADPAAFAIAPSPLGNVPICQRPWQAQAQYHAKDDQ